MSPGKPTVFHIIYIYEQKFNTVQTATANYPLRLAEDQFCSSVFSCILHSQHAQGKQEWYSSVYMGLR